jgi:hypothetical protein
MNDQMKVIKFKNYLVPLVLSGQKTSTWRLFDDKNLSTGDAIELREFGKEEPFATGYITKVIEKPFKDLTIDDKKGHEEYQSDAEMYKTYSGYYKTEVTSDTTVKIIWFELEQ